MNERDALEFLCQFQPKPDLGIKHSLRRFLKTIAWLPTGKKRVLDLGSDKYFIRLLARLRPEYEIHSAGLAAPRGAGLEANRFDTLREEGGEPTAPFSQIFKC